MITVFSSATDLSTAIGNGTISAQAVAQMYLDRITAKNSLVNAVVALRPQTAIIADATASTARAVAGTRLSPLDGVPFTVKLCLATPGLITANVNSTNYSLAPASYSLSDIVGKLVDAGCILLGKTNGPGLLPSRTVTSAFGETKNPYNTLFTTGGSAGGSACAVAMGFTGFDIAVDTAGSIRIPSAICGVIGFAPTNGSVSGLGDWTTDMPSMPPTDMQDLNKYGPIVRDSKDLAAIFQIIAGPTQLRSDIPRPYPCSSPTLHKIKSIKNIGPWTNNYQSQVDSILAAQTCIVDASSPNITFFDQTIYTNIYNGLAYDTTQLPTWFAATYGRTENPYFGAQIPYGISFTGKTYQARAHAIWLAAVAATLFGDVGRTKGDVDILAMGTVALSPPRITDSPDPASIAYMAYTTMWNITKHPCITVPIGFDSNGIPIGMQFVGRPGHDLDLAYFVNQVKGLPGFIPPTL